MNTTSTEDHPVPVTETWSDKSKKDMFLGLILVIAATASTPFLSILGNVGLVIPLTLVFIGITMAVAGYFSLKAW